MIFHGPEQIYLANADQMSLAMSNMKQLEAQAPITVETYATVVGGLAGLNYLPYFEPKNIIIYDNNRHALSYAKLIIEMINICETSKEFIERIFLRKITKELNVDTQDEYLKKSLDRRLFKGTMARLSVTSKEAFNKYLLPVLEGKVFDTPHNCQRLFPCWPIDTWVPVGVGDFCAVDPTGKIPNTNTFFYGAGWLESDLQYAKTRNLLKNSNPRFILHDLMEDPLSKLCDLTKPLALHVSNVERWYQDTWNKQVEEWQKKAKSLILITFNKVIR